MNINNINVNKYPVSQVFDPDSKVIFEIPKYQREYTWGTREWEALFDDLIENDDGYFLGSIICINSATDSINAPKFEVVDGQQRLTTLSLFLSALYTTLNSNKELLDEDQQADILQLKRKIVLKKTQSDMLCRRCKAAIVMIILASWRKLVLFRIAQCRTSLACVAS